MPRLPDIQDLGRRPVARPQVGIAQGEQPNIGTLLQPGQVMEGAGRQISSIGNEMQAVFEEEKKRLDTARAEDALNQVLTHVDDLTDGEQNGFRRQLGENAIKQPLVKNWNERLSNYVTSVSGSLDNDEQRNLLKRRADVIQRQFSGSLLQHVAKENDAYQSKVAQSTIEVSAKNAASNWNNPDMVFANLERARGVTTAELDRRGLKDEAIRKDAYMKALTPIHASVVEKALAEGNHQYAQGWMKIHGKDIDPEAEKSLDKAVEDGAQKQLFDGYQSDFLASKDSMKGLSALESKVMADKTLDDGRKNILIGRIESRSESLERRAEIQQMKAERAVMRHVDAVNALTLQGYEPTTEQMAPLVTAAKGTAMEPVVQQMIATANATRKFRNMHPREQEVYISNLESAARKDPTKFDVNVINRFKSIHSAQKDEVRKDPVTFAIRQGQVDADDPAAAPLDLSNPAQMQLGDRFTLARSMAARYGTPMKPLTQEESTALSGSLKSADVKQKRDYFAALFNSSGGDMEGYRAIMGQIAPDDPVTAAAGIAAARGYKSTKDRFVADLILRGQEVINRSKSDDGKPGKGVLPMPKETEMLSRFSSYEKDAFSGNEAVRNSYYQTAKSIYAAKAVEEGDYSGGLDSKRWGESMRLATGGIEKYRGRAVVMPYGVKYSDFKDGVHERISALAASGQLNPAWSRGKLEDLPLENVGDGRYILRAGDGVLVDRNGKRVIIDFEKR